MKKYWKIVPAIFSLLLSIVTLSASTYAWFTINQTVTASAMSLQVKAEEGILIANAEDGVYSDRAEAIKKLGQVYPTTTADFTTWYTAQSKRADDGMALTDEGYIEIDGVDLLPINYYLENTFWLKTSADGFEVSVAIDQVTVSDINTSAKMDASLRVAFVMGEDIFVYAPVNNEDSDSAPGHDATWSVITDSTQNSPLTTKITNIPVGFQVYCYFEGEDSSCRSENLTSVLDTVTIDFDISIIN